MGGRVFVQQEGRTCALGVNCCVLSEENWSLGHRKLCLGQGRN